MKKITFLSSFCGVSIFLASGCFGVAEAKRSVLTPRQNFSNKTQVIQWQTSSQTVSEGAGTVQVTAVLNAASTASISVPYSVSGSASAGSDYDAVSGTLTIPAGSTTASVSITIVNDTLVESSKTIVLTMGAPVGAVLGTVSTHTITILDNDVVPSPTPSPTVVPSPTPSSTISPKPSPTSSPTASPKPSPTPTVTATPSPSPSTACTAAPAGTYYVDSTLGSDSNNGTNTCTPWKTLARVNTATLNAGNQVLFRRGSTFYGSLIAKYSGVSGSPITYGAYGTGANPVITGFTTVSAWTYLGSNLWESANPVTSLSTVNMVLINGVNTPMGRFPNTGYLTYQSHTSNTITSSGLSSTPNWTGAELAFNVTTYSVGRNPITAHSGGTLTFTPNAKDGGIQKDGQRFIIQNDPRTLDSQNEWYFNPVTKTLRIYSTSQPTQVKVASVQNLFSSNTLQYITLDNLSFEGANVAAIALTNSKNISVQNCAINFSGREGIYGPFSGNSTGLKVENTTINNSNNSGIDISGDFDHAVIRNNTVTNSGLLYGMADYGNGNGNGSGMAIGISVRGPSSLVEYNTVENAGYNGINFRGDITVVQNNYINKFCQVVSDGGGIYTWVGSPNIPHSGMKILNNIVLNGATDPGIYLDDSSNGVTVSGNTVANNKWGIYLHNTFNSTVQNNNAYNNDIAILISNNDLNVTMSNVLIQNNVFLARTAQQIIMLGWPSERLAPVVKYSSNFYARPIDDNLTIELQFQTPYEYRRYSLSQWQAYSGQDANTRKSPVAITDVNDLQFEYNATRSPRTIPLTRPMIDVKGTKYSGSLTLQPFTSMTLIKDPAP